jgi:hypothetical protein
MIMTFARIALTDRLVTAAVIYLLPPNDLATS